MGDWEIGQLCDKMSCVFASLRKGEWAKGRMGDSEITNYKLRITGSLEKRQGDREMGRMGDWEIGQLCDKMSCVFASLREGEWAKGRMGDSEITNYKLRITERGVWRSDGATGRWGEWVIGRLGVFATK